MKPLYLDGRPALEVRLDGPALQVRRTGKADRWYPLQRLSRVVVSGAVSWQTEALLACADDGITVTFLDGLGSARARLLGRPGARQELRQRLVDLLDRADWASEYGQWVRATEHRAARWVAYRLGADSRAVRGTPDVRRMIAAAEAELGEGRAAGYLRHVLRGLLEARVIQGLAEVGLAAESELLQDGRPDLGGDLTRIALWYLEPARLGWLRRRKIWSERRGVRPRSIGRWEVTRLFEHNRRRVERAVGELVNRLHRWLVELY